jgi:hypothetical protein
LDPLSAWLEGLGLKQYAPVFAENGVDLNSLLLLTDGDLERLGVLLGHRRVLLNAIAERGIPLPGSPGRGGEGGVAATAERRHLTVMWPRHSDTSPRAIRS